ncbi:hypothetical protein [Streptomyces sp. NPDC050164]
MTVRAGERFEMSRAVSNIEALLTSLVVGPDNDCLIVELED